MNTTNSCSRIHCALYFSENILILVDLDSRAGTYLLHDNENGEKVDPLVEKKLKLNDRFMVAETEYTVVEINIPV